MQPNNLTFNAAINYFLDYCESKNLAPKTIHWYHQHLTDAAKKINAAAQDRFGFGAEK